jgi:hypothetical protein
MRVLTPCVLYRGAAYGSQRQSLVGLNICIYPRNDSLYQETIDYKKRQLEGAIRSRKNNVFNLIYFLECF